MRGLRPPSLTESESCGCRGICAGRGFVGCCFVIREAPPPCPTGQPRVKPRSSQCKFRAMIVVIVVVALERLAGKDALEFGVSEGIRLRYLVLIHAAEEWKRPPREWFEARTQFAVVFGERFVSHDETGLWPRWQAGTGPRARLR